MYTVRTQKCVTSETTEWLMLGSVQMACGHIAVLLHRLGGLPTLDK